MKRYAVLVVVVALVSGCSLVKGGGSSGAGTTIENAGEATVGAAVSGEIKTGATTSDFYRFTYNGKIRDLIKVRLENKSTTLRPDFKIYNADKSALLEKDDGTPGANAEQIISMKPGESIYIEVVPWNSAGAYQLSLTAQKAYDANEPNDDQFTATPLKFGNSIEGSIMDGDDQDWFHVTATTGKVSIVLENLSTTLKPDVYVFNADKSQIANPSDGTPGAGIDATVDLPVGQDFYVKVGPWGSSGKYRLTTRPAVLAADMAGALQAKGQIDLYGIYFDTDQTFVKPESKTTLTEVANLLKADPTLKLEVSGHTDNAGAKDHNQALSLARAQAVLAALAGQYGIDASRLTAKGYGDTMPVAPNDNPADKAKNRRVVLKKM
jgi:outer membrane protein OmpA-like peptidoglycan-associated protein